MQNLLAVVLCGGQSRRMGRDKGLIPAGDGSIWAQQVAAKLVLLQLPVVFSVNQKQVEEYARYIERGQLVVDSSEIPGPVGGVLSVHEQLPGKNLLLLACDMLEMDAATIRQTIDIYLKEPGFDFYVHQDSNFAQPFCGIYTAVGLERVSRQAKEHALAKFSMQWLLNGANTRRMPIENPGAFSNYNESTHGH